MSAAVDETAVMAASWFKFAPFKEDGTAAAAAAEGGGGRGFNRLNVLIIRDGRGTFVDLTNTFTIPLF
jgi:hypothetical protein